MEWGLLALPGSLIWLGVLLLPWKPRSTEETLDAGINTTRTAIDLSRITVLIPARNEEDCISETLDGLALQGSGLAIIVIDDQSDERNQDLS